MSARMRKEKSAATLAREANLTAVCLICASAAAVHQHYGAVCCYSCRAFFRRGISRIFTCVVGDSRCTVNSITRTNCKKCRFDRCLEVGMKPELVDATTKKKTKSMGGTEDQAGEDDIVEVQAAAASILASPGSILPHHLQFSPAAASASAIPAHMMQFTPPQLPSQPLPLYQLSGISPQPRVDSSILLQSLEERNRIVQQAEQYQQQQVLFNTGTSSVTYMPAETPRPGSSLGSHPVRQQTYYVFQPLTQTFEPVTIAEFLDQPAFEEVVEAEVEESDEEMQLHYVEAGDEEPDESTLDQEVIVEDYPGEEGRPDGGQVQFDQENEDHRIIQEYLRIQQRSVHLARSNSETSVCTPAEVINSPKIRQILVTTSHEAERRSGGIQLESPIRTALKTEVASSQPAGDDTTTTSSGRGVDIEELVDLCFQEELANRRGGGGGVSRPPEPKPVLAVKPLLRDTAAASCREKTLMPPRTTTRTGSSLAERELEPGEIPPEKLPLRLGGRPSSMGGGGGGGGAIAAEVSAGSGLLRGYCRPVLNMRSADAAAACIPEPDEMTLMLDEPEPGEIRPASMRPYSELEPGEIGSTGSSTAGELEPGEIADKVFCFRDMSGLQQQQRGSIVHTAAGRSSSSASSKPGPLHNISIASPVLPPRRLATAPPADAAAAVVVKSEHQPPPQRQFSVIQGPMKKQLPLVCSTPTRNLPAEKELRCEAVAAAMLQRPACSRSQELSLAPAVTVIHHHSSTPGMSSPLTCLAQDDTETAALNDSTGDIAVTDDIGGSLLARAVVTVDSDSGGGTPMNVDQDESDLVSDSVRVADNTARSLMKPGSGLIEHGPSGGAVRKKRRRTALGTAAGEPLKKRRIMQECRFPVSLGVSKSKSLYLKFTLEEDFLMHQVLEARNLLSNRLFRQSIQLFPDQMTQYFRQAAACSLTDRKIDVDMEVFRQWSHILKDEVMRHGGHLVAILRPNTATNLMAALVQHSFYAFYAVHLAIFFGNKAASSMLCQEKFLGSTDETAWKYFKDRVPFIDAATSLKMQDFTLYHDEGMEILADTFTKAGQVTGSDEKLAALAMLVILVSQPQGSPFEKSKHVRNLRNQAATLMYRYLCSKSGHDEGRAAELTYSFVGLMQDLHRCGNILIGDKEWAQRKKSGLLPALTSTSTSSSSPPSCAAWSK